MAQQQVCLVVDDERPVRGYIASILQQHGFKTVEAENGEEALNVVRLLHGRVDLVVSDIRMEHMDGITLAQSLRAEFPKLPILLVSGYTDRLEDLPALGVELIEKPFLAATLLKAISTALER